MPVELTLEEVKRITGGTVRCRELNTIIKGVSTDTRTIKSGELFIALKGNNFDGHNFIKDAFRKGAVAVIAKKGFKQRMADGIVIRVNDTLKALGDIAKFWRSKFNVKVVDITGSNGKTTTKELIAGVLSQKFNVLATEGNLNNLIGVPQMIFKLSDEHEFAVFELGTSRFGEIARLSEITAPSIGVITCIAPAHIEFFKSLQGVLREKIQLGRYLKDDGLLIYNGDDKILSEGVKKLKCNKLSFGFNRDCMVRCTGIISLGENGSEFCIRSAGVENSFKLRLIGRQNILNALPAIACGIYAGVEVEKIREGLMNVSPLKGRWLKIKGHGGSIIIDDTYNANPASLITGIEEVIQIYGDRRITLVIGDMLELGRSSRRLHKEAGEKISSMNIYRLFTIGELARDIATGAKAKGFPADKIYITESKEEVVRELKDKLNERDVVYVKGSRALRMEEIVKELEVK